LLEVIEGDPFKTWRLKQTKTQFAKHVRERGRQDTDWIGVTGQGAVDTSGSKVKETTFGTLNEGGRVDRNYRSLI